MRTRLFLLTAMLGSFFAPTSVSAAETADSYQQHFKYYLGYTQAVGTQDVCVERVKNQLRQKIEQTKRYNDWFRAQGPKGEKYLEDEPGEIEKEAAAYVISICQMSLGDLHNLARDYRYGSEGLDLDFGVAASIYFYIFDVYDDISAIHCLKGMEYIRDARATDKKREALYKSPEIQQKNSYLHYFKKYLGFIKRAPSSDKCIEWAERHKQSAIGLARKFNKTTHEGLSQAEMEAVARVKTICEMPPDDLSDLAQNYRYGREGYARDKEIAIGLYYYVMSANNDMDARHLLQDLGENIATERPTKEDWEEIREELEALAKPSETGPNEHKEKIEAILNRILSFPSPPE